MTEGGASSEKKSQLKGGLPLAVRGLCDAVSQESIISLYSPAT